jgi:hypothetical protein
MARPRSRPTKHAVDRYEFGEQIKTVAPLVAALDKWSDASGPFALWLEQQGIISAYIRYKGDLPAKFHYVDKNPDWQKLERDYLTSAGLMKRAVRFQNGGMPTAKAAQALFAYALTFIPVLLLALWLANRK